MRTFLERFDALPEGYSEGRYQGRRYAATISLSSDGKRRKLYAEELGGRDHVSFNLFILETGAPLLKPCEMPAEKVIDFVCGFAPDADD